MDHNTISPIVITNGLWMHIRCTWIHHRNYPEIRGEGASPRDAARHLTAQLTQALDFARGPEGREELEQALADVRAARRPRSRPRRRDGVIPSESTTIS